MSIVFSLYFFATPAKTEDTHARFRRHFTIGLIRNSWEKGKHPLLKFLNSLHTPYVFIEREIKIRVRNDDHVSCKFLYNGKDLSKETKLLFVIPGGGFIAMSPENYFDFLSIIAAATNLPLVAIDYRKAPEHPFPAGFNDCFDVYKRIISTNAKDLGFKSVEPIEISLIGDSAGGNLSMGLMIRLISEKLRMPKSAYLLCPILTFEVQGWMSEQDQTLIRTQMDPEEQIKNGLILQEELESIRISGVHVTSRLRYFNDLIIPPEYLLGMGLMYLKDYKGHDPKNDVYLSPLLADDEYLKLLPKIYLQVGKHDPLCDDSILLYAKLKSLGRGTDSLHILPGMSHGYLQMLALVPEARIAVDELCKDIKINA